jgi:hypothetical protein
MISLRLELRNPMSRALIIIGLAIAAVGLLLPWIARLGLGWLPGDIYVQREGFTFYAPIATSIVLSVVLSIILWLLSR